MSVTVTDFGDGYRLITLENSHGLKLSCTDFGARLTSLVKHQVSLVLGFDKASDYQQTPGGAIYFGAIVGRVAGRIRGAQATISGKSYEFTANFPSKAGITFSINSFPKLSDASRGNSQGRLSTAISVITSFRNAFSSI